MKTIGDAYMVVGGLTEGPADHTARVAEMALAQGFFAALQTVEVPWPAERRAFASLARSHGLTLTYCAARVLNENKLNLATADETPPVRPR